MESYNNYMDGISVDAELHKKIMRKVTQKPAPLYRRRAVYRYAGLAACAAVLAVCYWAFPGLRNKPGEINPDNPVVTHYTPQPDLNGEQSVVVNDIPNEPDAITDIPDDSDTIIPGLRDEEFPLALNKAESLMQAGRLWPDGFFYHLLIDEQIGVVFPNLNVNLAATAFYRPDGTLIHVTARETYTPGRADAPVMVNEYYPRTEIQLGEGEIIEDCVMLFDGTPII